LEDNDDCDEMDDIFISVELDDDDETVEKDTEELEDELEDE
jgi:hypothetical protein